jgi:hypothetical protein
VIPNPFKDLHALRSEKRKAGKREESRSALPKAKENLINWIWYEVLEQAVHRQLVALCGGRYVGSRRRTR